MELNRAFSICMSSDAMLERLSPDLNRVTANGLILLRLSPILSKAP